MLFYRRVRGFSQKRNEMYRKNRFVIVLNLKENSINLQHLK